MIELIQLDYLRAFVEYGTLTKAAEELHMSQPALTRSMQKLEEELGVTLFTRQKNKLTLNETGQMASELARIVLSSADNMVQQVRTFDLSRRTINIGSCAPMPLEEVQPKMTRLYSNMRIASKLEGDTEQLIKDFKDEVYDLIILPYSVDAAGILCKPLMDEQLYFLLPKSNPLAVASGLHLKDMDGETMVLLSDIGFWRTLVDEKMPHTSFILQTDRTAFQQIVDSSNLPSFVSSHYLNETYPQGKVPIPILDPEATVTYYGIGKKRNSAKNLALFWDQY